MLPSTDRDWTEDFQYLEVNVIRLMTWYAEKCVREARLKK